jgi:hypothetical protein
MKTGVAGSRLGVGRAKDQFQVASFELQARKTTLVVGGRKRKKTGSPLSGFPPAKKKELHAETGSA